MLLLCATFSSSLALARFERGAPGVLGIASRNLGAAPAAAGASPGRGPLALPDLPAYIKEIEGIRMLSFKHPVAHGKQSLAEFRQFVLKDLDSDLPPPRAACVSRSLGLLGLLPDSFDLRKAFSELLVTQVAAYYNPYKKTFFIVHPDLPESFLKPTVIHELTHALQDQQFGLESRIKGLQRADNDDQENAFRFLAEGEATYVMMLSALRENGVDLTAGGVALDQAIDVTSGMGREGIIAQIESTKASLGPEMAAEVEAVLSYPDFLFRILFDPYFGGLKGVHHVFHDGGWDAVNGLWTNPPKSTEMFLHPEKLEGGGREEPVKVDVPDLSSALGPGYAPTCENTLGEMETEILFEVTLPASAAVTARTTAGSVAPPTPATRVERARTAAAGWGGDRYRTFEKNGGGTIVVWKTEWDTEQDAVEFEDAMREASRSRLAAKITQRREESVVDPKAVPLRSPGAQTPTSNGQGRPPTTPTGPEVGTVETPLTKPALIEVPPPAGWIQAPLSPEPSAARAPAGSDLPGNPPATSAASARGFLLVRNGKEALFVAGANAGQARAILAALAPAKPAQ